MGLLGEPRQRLISGSAQFAGPVNGQGGLHGQPGMLPRGVDPEEGGCGHEHWTAGASNGRHSLNGHPLNNYLKIELEIALGKQIQICTLKLAEVCALQLSDI